MELAKQTQNTIAKMLNLIDAQQETLKEQMAAIRGLPAANRDAALLQNLIEISNGLHKAIKYSG